MMKFIGGLIPATIFESSDVTFRGIVVSEASSRANGFPMSDLVYIQRERERER